MIILLTAHLLAAGAAVPLVRRWGARGVAVTALAPLAALVWVLTVLATDGPAGAPGSGGAIREQSVAWMPDLGIDLALRLDALGALLAVVITAVGALVLLYSSGYFAPHGTGEEPAEDRRTRTRTTSLLVAFSATMLVVVLADDLMVLYAAWEVTTILSWLLVGGEGKTLRERRPAAQALLVTTAGGLAMLVGFVLLWQITGTTRISEIVADPPPVGPAVVAAAVLVLAGAVTKSALVPFTAWLPGAMVAPTPVSAYLHAAAMVKAGVYLVARFSPVFTDVPAWQLLAVGLGAATMLVGGWRALRQNDLKLLLAHGTVSQLGFLVVLFGIGGRTGAIAGAAMLLAHALFKSTLFLVVGAIDHSTGTRDLRELSGLARRSPALLVAAVLAAASMAGLPPLLGFVGKEAGFEALLEGVPEGSPVPGVLVLVLLVLGSVLTAGYSLRFVWGAFATKPGTAPTPWHAPATTLVVPPVVLAAAGLVLGALPALLDPLAVAVAEPFPADAVSEEGYHLALWHGLGVPLYASAVALVGGVLLFLARERVARAGTAAAAAGPLPAVAPGAVYDRVVHALAVVATRVTKATQRGSLPQYLFGVLMVLLLGPGTALVLAIADGGWPDGWRAWDSPAQPALGVLVVVASLAAARATHRRGAVVLAGAAGYGVAGMFVVAGAPDLALTQVLVETLTLVCFVLVLRLLPTRFTARGTDRGQSAGGERSRTAARIVVAALAGLAMAGMSVVALAARTATPISVGFPRIAYDFGGGENVVNVTLVDIRAWDTFGEITVLVVAATGIASLVFLRGRTGSAPRIGERPATPLEERDLDGDGLVDAVLVPDRRRELVTGPLAISQEDWLPAVSTVPAVRRSLVLEFAVRLVYPTVLVVSVYLLFSGHDNPGGGFAGGLVAGLALVLRYLAGGRYELGEALRVPPGVLLGSGLMITALSAAAPLLVGGQAIQSYVHHVDVPLLGDTKVVTSVVFDVGVYLIVIGLVLDVLRSLGAEVDRLQEVDEQLLAEGRAVHRPASEGPEADAGRGDTRGGTGGRDEGSHTETSEEVAR